jgi:hypothetical protein
MRKHKEPIAKTAFGLSDGTVLTIGIQGNEAVITWKHEGKGRRMSVIPEESSVVRIRSVRESDAGS